MLTILAAVLVFGILVTVHEFGHFITAKLTGMRVDEFAIGFGPKLYQQKVHYDGDDGIHTESVDETNILKLFDEMMSNFDEANNL